MAKFKTASRKCFYILLVQFHLPFYFFEQDIDTAACFIYFLVPLGDRRLGPGGSIKCSFWWEISHCVYSIFYSKFGNLNKINACKEKNVYGCEKKKTLIVSCFASFSTVKKTDKSNKNTTRVNRTYSIVPMFLY